MKSTKTRFDGITPKVPHMIVEFRPGAFLAMIPGSKMGIVMDPTKRSEFHKLALYSITESVIRFKCFCNPTCSVIHEYKRLPTKGVHAK